MVAIDTVIDSRESSILTFDCVFDTSDCSKLSHIHNFALSTSHERLLLVLFSHGADGFCTLDSEFNITFVPFLCGSDSTESVVCGDFSEKSNFLAVISSGGNVFVINTTSLFPTTPFNEADDINSHVWRDCKISHIIQLEVHSVTHILTLKLDDPSDSQNFNKITSHELESEHTFICGDHGTPTCLLWWSTSSFDSLAIIGYSNGLVVFVDLVDKSQIGVIAAKLSSSNDDECSDSKNVHLEESLSIISMRIVQDSMLDFTRLMINFKSSFNDSSVVQFQSKHFEAFQISVTLEHRAVNFNIIDYLVSSTSSNRGSDATFDESMSSLRMGALVSTAFKDLTQKMTPPSSQGFVDSTSNLTSINEPQQSRADDPVAIQSNLNDSENRYNIVKIHELPVNKISHTHETLQKSIFPPSFLSSHLCYVFSVVSSNDGVSSLEIYLQEKVFEEIHGEPSFVIQVLQEEDSVKKEVRKVYICNEFVFIVFDNLEIEISIIDFKSLKLKSLEKLELDSDEIVLDISATLCFNSKQILVDVNVGPTSVENCKRVTHQTEILSKTEFFDSESEKIKNLSNLVSNKLDETSKSASFHVITNKCVYSLTFQRDGGWLKNILKHFDDDSILDMISILLKVEVNMLREFCINEMMFEKEMLKSSLTFEKFMQVMFEEAKFDLSFLFQKLMYFKRDEWCERLLEEYLFNLNFRRQFTCFKSQIAFKNMSSSYDLTKLANLILLFMISNDSKYLESFVKRCPHYDLRIVLESSTVKVSNQLMKNRGLNLLILEEFAENTGELLHSSEFLATLMLSANVSVIQSYCETVLKIVMKIEGTGDDVTSRLLDIFGPSNPHLQPFYDNINLIKGEHFKVVLETYINLHIINLDHCSASDERRTRENELHAFRDCLSKSVHCIQEQSATPVSSNSNSRLMSSLIACSPTHVLYYEYESQDLLSWGNYHPMCAVLPSNQTSMSRDSAVLGRCSVLSSNVESYKPSSIPFAPFKVISVSCGIEHNLLLTDTGFVYCWGISRFGQLGLGLRSHNAADNSDFICRVHPTRITGGELMDIHIAIICCGHYHSLASDGRDVWAWGWNTFGQLGINSVEDQSTPCRLQLPSSLLERGICAIKAGYAHSIILDAIGEVWVIGSGKYGQLGRGVDDEKQLTPLHIMNLGVMDVKLIDSGDFCSVAVMSTNRVFTWGCHPQTLNLKMNKLKKNLDKFKLINADKDVINYLVRMKEVIFSEKLRDDEVVIAVKCGSKHCLILTDSGTVYGYGRNFESQLAYVGSSNTNEMFIRLNKVVEHCGSDEKIIGIAAGGYFSLVQTESKSLFGFGSNSCGQLGLKPVAHSRKDEKVVATNFDKFNGKLRDVISVPSPILSRNTPDSVYNERLDIANPDTSQTPDTKLIPQHKLLADHDHQSLIHLLQILRVYRNFYCHEKIINVLNDYPNHHIISSFLYILNGEMVESFTLLSETLIHPKEHVLWCVFYFEVASRFIKLEARQSSTTDLIQIILKTVVTLYSSNSVRLLEETLLSPSNELQSAWRIPLFVRNVFHAIFDVEYFDEATKKNYFDQCPDFISTFSDLFSTEFCASVAQKFQGFEKS